MVKNEKKVIEPKLRFPEFRAADGWVVPKLGSLGSFTGGGTPSKEKTDYWTGQNPWVSSSDISEEGIQDVSISRYISDEAIQATATKMVPANSILLVSRVGVGKLAISREPICTSQDFTNFTPTKDDLVFLAYCLKSLKFKLLAFNQGMAIKGFTKNDISNLEIPLPSLVEQQKITDCLSSLDELIAAQGRKVEALKTYKRGLMQQLFPREGEALPRLRFPEFRDAPEWADKKLSEVIDLVSGLHLSPDEYSAAGDVPYYTGPSDFSNDVQCATKWTKASANVAKEHDTLITVKGSGVGEVWYLEMPTVAMGRQLMAVRAHHDCSSRFIFQVLLTKRSRFEDLAAGNLIPGLARGDILNLVASIPEEDEQRTIAGCLSSLDDQIAVESQQLDALKSHKKGLMQQLFPSPEEL